MSLEKKKSQIAHTPMTWRQEKRAYDSKCGTRARYNENRPSHSRILGAKLSGYGWHGRLLACVVGRNHPFSMLSMLSML